MSEQLKPCPFCGSEPHDAHHIEYGRWAVTCNCGVVGACANTGPNASDAAKIKAYNDARHAWNNRALTTSQPAQAGEVQVCPLQGCRARILPTQPAAQVTPERHLTVTTNQQGDAVMVSWQDDEHRILEVVWERATPPQQAAGEPVGGGVRMGRDRLVVHLAWETRSSLRGTGGQDVRRNIDSLPFVHPPSAGRAGCRRPARPTRRHQRRRGRLRRSRRAVHVGRDPALAHRRPGEGRGVMFGVLLMTASVLVVLALPGYLAACAGAQKWINFIDWLFLREHRVRSDEQAKGGEHA